MHPMHMAENKGLFPENTYIIFNAISKDDIGMLFSAEEQEISGIKKPLLWKINNLLLFPRTDSSNIIIDEGKEESYKALEKTKSSLKMTAMAYAQLSGDNETAFQIDVKKEKMYKLNMSTLKHNPAVKNYMLKELKKNPKMRFGYVRAVYEGIMSIQLYNNYKLNGAGGYAAFEMAGDFYMISQNNYLNKGLILYEIVEVTPEQLLKESVYKKSYSKEEIKTIVDDIKTKGGDIKTIDPDNEVEDKELRDDEK